MNKITAKQAKSLVEKKEKEVLENKKLLSLRELESCYNVIRQNAEKGKNVINVGIITELTREALTKDGFSIQFIDAKYPDQDYYSVSWK